MSYLKQVIEVQARCTMATADFLRLEGADFNVMVPRFRVCAVGAPIALEVEQTFMIDAEYRNAHCLKGCERLTNWRWLKRQEQQEESER